MASRIRCSGRLSFLRHKFDFPNNCEAYQLLGGCKNPYSWEDTVGFEKESGCIIPGIGSCCMLGIVWT